MIMFLRFIAFVCLISTPFQATIVLWGSWIAFSSDYTILSLSILEFFTHYFSLVRPVIDWFYTWIDRSFLDLILGLPIVVMSAFKGIIGTWLGFYSLRMVKELDPSLVSSET